MPATVGALAPRLPCVRRGIRRFRQVYGRRVDQIIWARGYEHRLHDLGRWTGHRRRARATAAAAEQEKAASDHRDPDARSAVHCSPMLVTGFGPSGRLAEFG